MIKFTMAILILGIFSMVAWADSYETLSSLLQFHGSVAELSKQAPAIDPKKLYLVEGMLVSVNVVNDSTNNYYAEVEFLSSEYTADEEIQNYRIKLVFSKPVFQNLLVPKSGKILLPGQFGINSRGMALIQYIKSDKVNQNEKYPVFIVQDFRILN